MSRLNRHAASLYLGLTLVVVALSHLAVEKQDDGYLLSVDGKRYDMLGAFRDATTRLLADCAGIGHPLPEEPTYAAALEAIRNYSPPASGSARIASMSRLGNWVLAELEFDDLLPAVALLREQDGKLVVQDGAIWSGTTKPWKAAPLIRRYIGRRAPDVPPSLLDCFSPASASFR